jgi:hypothetical protein
VKVNFFIALIFSAVITIAVIANISETSLIGCTELNGSGCVCHSVERDTLVHVWVEGPDTLIIGQTGYYKMFLTSGPAEAGGYNVAGRFGEMVLLDTFSFKHPLVPNELTQAFSLPFPSPMDTIYWAFGYTASDTSAAWDTIYSCGLSLVWDSIPDPLDRWNFGAKFLVKIELPDNIDKENLFVKDFKLFQNYPNPFNPTTKIKFIIPFVETYRDASLPTTLKVYDVLGDEVAALVNEEKSAGSFEIEYNATELPGGVYFYQLKAGDFIETKKMVLIR